MPLQLDAPAKDASLQKYPDDELISIAKDGDDSALGFLLDKYKNFVRVKARTYFLIGADREDLIQEGMIGLYKAIRDFRDDKKSSFRVFAELCIQRQIITAIKTANRQKHIPLNSYVSLNKSLYYDDESDRTLAEVLPGAEVTDPIEIVISSEELRGIRACFAEILSDLEAKVIRRYIEGKSYCEIAEELDREVKSVDNALQRVKRKIELYLRRRQA